MFKLLRLSILFSLLLPSAAFAQNLVPFEVRQAVVLVICDDRQGSGTVINGQEGYVLTNAHVVRDVEKAKTAASCNVGFLERADGEADVSYHASIVQWTFDEERNLDFAVLKIGRLLSGRGIARPFPYLKTNEFAIVGERISVLGYSNDGRGLAMREGTVSSFENGFIQTDAVIRQGDSGGASLDPNGRLIGMPTRIVTYTTEDAGRQRETFELVDIRAVMNWLDTFGKNAHDGFFTHEDFPRYHQNAVFVSEASLGCLHLARTELSSTVYCLLPDGTRRVFPNDDVFFSWEPDFRTVKYATLQAVSQFAPTRNVTYKPGSLVKSATSPKVYVVVDGFGTLRHVPSESRAIQLWGPNWTSLVHDVDDAFWTNYVMGQPLDS